MAAAAILEVRHLRKVYRKLDIKSRRELAGTSLADG